MSDPTIELEELSIVELAAIAGEPLPDTPGAERLEQSALQARAVAELRRRAAVRDFAAGDTTGPELARAAGDALDALGHGRRPDDVAAHDGAATNDQADDDDGELELTAGELERLLEGRGYISVRGDLLRCAQTVMDVDPKLLKATLRYAVNALSKARAGGGRPEVIDAIANEVAVFEAIHAFKRTLTNLEDKANARAVLLGKTL